jgi:putative acetyltransferase
MIRTATREDADAVRCVYMSAFPEGEGDIVSKLAVDLLFEATEPPIHSLLAEAEGAVVGHVAFSPVRGRDTKELLGYILAPLAVRSDSQKRGIGSRLIKSGIERLSALGAGVLLVYGDPRYYGRFGFTVDAAEGSIPPYTLQYPLGWQGMALGGCGVRKPAVRISCVSALNNPVLW